MTCSKSAKWLIDLNNYLDIAYSFKKLLIETAVYNRAIQNTFLLS